MKFRKYWLDRPAAAAAAATRFSIAMLMVACAQKAKSTDLPSDAGARFQRSFQSLDGGTSIQCGPFRGVWVSEGEDQSLESVGAWRFWKDGVLIHTGDKEIENAGGPFSEDCQRVVLFERERGAIAIYQLSESQAQWPQPKTVVRVPTESGKPCAVAGAHWQDSTRISLVVGCHGWHGATALLVDTAQSNKWFVDGPAACSVRTPYPATFAEFEMRTRECASEPSAPFDWRQ